MFGNPPIAIHHDFSKCDLDPADLPSHVQIVRNWIPTAWGTLSLVKAYLAALELLHAVDGPEWTVSLSGTDYPVMSAQRILHELRFTTADAFFDYREIGTTPDKRDEALSPVSNYKTAKWLKAARGRYLGFSLMHYHLRKWMGRADRPFYVSNALTTRLFTPFSANFRPFAGDAWHTINKRSASILLSKDDTVRRLQRYYNKRVVPDESYCHTLLLNRKELCVRNNNRRFSIWLNDSPHPKTLGYEDIPLVLASNAHFARKFPFNPTLYQAVDAEVQIRDTAAERSNGIPSSVEKDQ